ncbi:MAG: HAMP domain-containing histidine kinase [Anaerolineae bacterium]|nr:HAMP domain-containing histidine kinase [Anaerolineae bacterium]
MSLRTRLFASYLLLLAWSFGVVIAVLFIFLGSQPEPPSTTYQQLFAIARANRRDISIALTSPFRTQAENRLQTLAQENTMRVMVVNTLLKTVSYDSAGIYPVAGETLDLLIDNNYDARQYRNWIPEMASSIFGSFVDNEQKSWLFIGLQVGATGEAIIMADLRPNRSLQSTLEQFGPPLGIPLLQSAIIGLIVALVLATIISGTIARPLQQLAKATRAVAQGDYEHKVIIEGPPEIRAVAESFNLMIGEVRNTQQSQRDFLVNVSHDLKTPLTSIQGYSQAIMDGAVKDQNQAAAIIHDEAGRLNRMVSELTELARLQVGGVKMQISAINVGQIVGSIAGRLAMVAASKHIMLHTDIQSVPLIAGDGDRLAQVFTNLISNAINYTPEGGTIWVRVSPDRGGVAIGIRDNGIGIPQAELPRIFERFYQVDKTRGPRRGTGLGLAITREIVLAHGGEVIVTSAGEGLGSIFTVWLPAGRLAD